MKRERKYFFLGLFIILFGSIDGQDTIILKTGDTIPALIIQMDFQNIYFKRWDNQDGNIQSVNKTKYDEVIFKSYPDSKLDSLIFDSKAKQDIGIKVDRKDLDKIKQKPFSLNFSILPLLDLSGTVDISPYSTLELGVGIGYVYAGTRIYFKKADVKKRFYGALYLYRIKLFAKKASTYVYMPMGFNYTSDDGFTFKAELGIFMKGDLSFTIPMPKLGFGMKF